MVTDLVEWLRAALDETERAIVRYRDGHDGSCLNYEGQDSAGYDEYGPCALHIATARGTPFRDVEFGLRQVVAHRRILAEAERELADDETNETARWLTRVLASIYADRLGYQPEWALDGD